MILSENRFPLFGIMRLCTKLALDRLWVGRAALTDIFGDIADEHDLTILADEVYGELGFDGPIPLLGQLDPAQLAPAWREAVKMVQAGTPARRDVWTQPR